MFACVSGRKVAELYILKLLFQTNFTIYDYSLLFELSKKFEKYQGLYSSSA